jgi:putative transposase
MLSELNIHLHILFYRCWLYLVAVIDIYSRKVIGWQLDKNLNSNLVERALKSALMDRRVERGIIFHSDQGLQYASEGFRKILRDNGFIQSMSRKRKLL